MDNITKDPAYNAVDPRDFPAMLDVHRYGQRSNAFDKIISATHEHFWDPLDRKYIDFSQAFDTENEYLVNPSANTDLKTAIADKLDEKQKIKLVNLDVWWSFSSILHGEQGALSLSASLCHILRDPGAQVERVDECGVVRLDVERQQPVAVGRLDRAPRGAAHLLVRVREPRRGE